jgi:hypothetical protein
MDNNLLACKCLIELVSGVFAQLVLAMVFKTIGGFEQSSQWVQFPYIPAFQSPLDTELRTSKGISICHGLIRNYTEGKPSRSRRICHGRTRKNTERRTSRRISHGNKTLLSEPDA